MISLRRLAVLATGRFDDARTILETFARFVDGGMIPNLFPENPGDAPEYNTADATLWYIEAWRAYVEATGDEAALRKVFAILVEIIAAHQRGTRYGIGVDPVDGFCMRGEPASSSPGWTPKSATGSSPRASASRSRSTPFGSTLSPRWRGWRSGSAKARTLYGEAASRAKTGFARFAMPGRKGALPTVIDGPDGDDSSLRPNQIFAVSLPYTPLEPMRQRAVLDSCAPLVTLQFTACARWRPARRIITGRVAGARPSATAPIIRARSGPGCSGALALAQIRVFRRCAAAAQRSLEGIAAHLSDAGLGTVSEIFDADPPHTPRGCAALAWSVAWVRDAWWKLVRAKNRHPSPLRGATLSRKRAREKEMTPRPLAGGRGPSRSDGRVRATAPSAPRRRRAPRRS